MYFSVGVFWYPSVKKLCTILIYRRGLQDSHIHQTWKLTIRVQIDLILFRQKHTCMGDKSNYPSISYYESFEYENTTRNYWNAYPNSYWNKFHIHYTKPSVIWKSQGNLILFSIQKQTTICMKLILPITNTSLVTIHSHRCGVNCQWPIKSVCSTNC